MVAPSSGTSQVECEPYRSSHSAYRIPQSNPSTPYDQTEPRTLPSSQPSSRITESSYTSAASSTSATPASQPSQTPNQTPSSDRSRGTPQVSQSTTPVTHVRHSSAVSASAPNTATSSPIRHRRSSSLQNTSPMAQPATVQLRDLAHLLELARADANNNGSSQSFPRRRARFTETRFDVSQMPVPDIIELVSALLTKITTTNDRNHENLHRNMPTTDSSGNLPEQATSVLAFHGKNVPTITIHSYLSRIHRYCPTTYEVFLSLLVYFDRMTERVNAGTVHQTANLRPATPGSATVPPQDASGDHNQGLGNFFVVDSYNIHRLVIAGVTCASKFFSDIFYTNSRYAKVGGLPLVELNHLELQFLTLNDFRLSIPVEELESYGNMLVQFYAREELARSQESTASE
ncbi:Cyclin-U4-1 [Dactylella cylindrospora]|nr:Cyclin-U4-1 [Dactylella cylindrospora]